MYLAKIQYKTQEMKTNSATLLALFNKQDTLCLFSNKKTPRQKWHTEVSSRFYNVRPINQTKLIITYHVIPSSRSNMQGITKALRLHGRQLRHAVLQHMNKGIFSWATLISRIQSESPTVIIPHMGLENITVSEILKAKGEAETGAVYWCSTSHLVHEAVQHVSINVFGEQQRIYLSPL
jgi:hypothetical protein